MAPEIKTHEEHKYINEQQKQKNEKTNKQLNAQIEKKDGHVDAGIELMAKTEIKEAQQEIDALGLSSEELKNKNYTGQFKTANENFTKEVKEITDNPDSTPEEKTKALEIAFEKFQTTLWSIKGTNEAKDAQRATEQRKNMENQQKQETEKSQKFKETLLGNINKITEQKAQEQVKEARKLSNIEHHYAREQAEKSQWATGNVALAFWPPGTRVDFPEYP